MRENADQNNSENEHFLRSGNYMPIFFSTFRRSIRGHLEGLQYICKVNIWAHAHLFHRYLSHEKQIVKQLPEERKFYIKDEMSTH